MRVGIGYDIHRLVPSVDESTIPIGGVKIPCFFKIKAHSDGDVLLHALVDACLGALALGDIGQWFPDNDPKHRGRPSRDFVASVLEEVRRLGWRVKQLDANLHLETPKLRPFVEEIRLELARMLNVELSGISVKAKTNETLGPIGERKAVAANVIVVLEPLEAP